jgi:serine/threonine-protein kinase
MIRANSAQPPSITKSGFRSDLEPVSGETRTLLKISGLPRMSPDADRRRAPTQSGTAQPLAAGQELGPYRLLEWLGRGGQGEVWKARRLDADERLVALKVLTPRLARNADRMAQFRREAERGTRLVGPSLLTIHELAEADGYHFMTMPYVECTALREIIAQRHAYLCADDTACRHHFVDMERDDYLRAMARTLAEAARALALVHQQRVAHRDIKPANILLDHRHLGGVYLCDFGLGRDLDFATPDQMRDGAGTPLYMAPERLLRSAADETKCDVYSMGVTLFEALTLARPFRVPRHVGPAGVAPFLARAQPRRPSVIDPRFPDELESIVMKAMARAPRRRHDSAGELAQDLERFAKDWSSCGGLMTALTPRRRTAHQRHTVRNMVPAHGNGALDESRCSSACPDLCASSSGEPINDTLAD